MLDFLRQVLNSKAPSGRITLGDFLRGAAVAALVGALQYAFLHALDLVGTSVAAVLVVGTLHRWVAGRLPAIDDADSDSDSPAPGTMGPPLAAEPTEPRIPPVAYAAPARVVPGPGEYDRHAR